MLGSSLHCLKHLIFFYLCLFPFKDTPEFDLVFDNTVDQWVANSSADKCIFVQILYHGCLTYCKRKEASLGKTGQTEKRQEPQLPLQVAPGPDNRTRQSASKAQPAQTKSCVSLSRPEFINCQSKLTRGNRSYSR